MDRAIGTLIASLAITSASLTVRDASACTALQEPPWIAPAEGQTIPADAPAIAANAWIDPSQTWSLTAAKGGSIELLAETGGIFRPKTPLAADETYTFAFRRFATDSTTTHTFKTTTSLPLPTTLGSIMVSKTARGPLEVDNFGGACTGEIDAAYVDVKITPSPDLAPWMPLVRFTASVDGVAFAKSPYGTTTNPAPMPSARKSRSVEQIFARCAPKDDGSDPGVAPGKHVLTVGAHVAGAATDPPALTASIDLDCGDAGAPTDAGSDASSSPDAGGDSVSPASPSGPAASASCAWRAMRDASVSHAPLFIALATLPLLRRRRR